MTQETPLDKFVRLTAGHLTTEQRLACNRAFLEAPTLKEFERITMGCGLGAGQRQIVNKAFEVAKELRPAPVEQVYPKDAFPPC